VKETANFKSSGSLSSGADLNLNSSRRNHHSAISSRLNLSSDTNVTILINCGSKNNSACGKSSDNIFTLPPNQVNGEDLLTMIPRKTSLVSDRVETPNLVKTEQKNREQPPNQICLRSRDIKKTSFNISRPQRRSQR
jgi:hypothetical protein